MKKIRKYEKYLKIIQESCELSKIFIKISIETKKSLNYCIISTLKFFKLNYSSKIFAKNIIFFTTIIFFIFFKR